MQMDVATISQLVSNLGFPIVCVGIMFWMQNKERESHAAESERWTEVVKENTAALRQWQLGMKTRSLSLSLWKMLRRSRSI